MHVKHDPAASAAAPIAFDDFLKVDIRVGEVREAAPLANARNPTLRLVIDFGPTLGLKTSCAQITTHYGPDTLIGKRVLAVVNFPPRQIGKTISEVLTLGVPDANGEVVLVTPDQQTPLGGRLF